MRITRPVLVLLILTCVWIGAGHSLLAGQTKYGVTVNTVKPAPLAKARTYVWRTTRPSFNKAVDVMIVAAVDRELSARGFTKLASGKSDVIVTYASIGRTDVDLKSLQGATPREVSVGTLVVDLLDPANDEALFRVRIDSPIERDMATIEAAINAAVTEMFGKYPAPAKP